MSFAPGWVLDDSNSRPYRTRPGPPKHARIEWSPREYTLSWGVQQFSGPHMLVLDPAGHYGVELATFFATHIAVSDVEDHYVKVVAVRAVCVEETFELTTIVSGQVEMTATVPAGGYVVQNPDGEQYAMGAEDFFRRYELAE